MAVARERFVSLFALSPSILTCNQFTRAKTEIDGRSLSQCCKELEGSKWTEIPCFYINLRVTLVHSK